MTVKDQNGKVVFSKSKEYAVNDLYLEVPGAKQVPLANWDITAQHHISTGIEPTEIDSNTFVIPLEDGTTSVDVEASYIFHYEEGHSATVHKLNRKVTFK